MRSPRGLLLLISLLVFQAAAADEPLSFLIIDGVGNPVANAAIILKSGALAPDAANQPAVMDQINQEFTPSVLIVPLGSLVKFPNSDDTRHHVYSFSPAKTFEINLYHGDEADPVQFDKPGVVKLGCNIHDSMRGYIVITEFPYFDVSNSEGIAMINAAKSVQGSIDLENLKIQVWHPQLPDVIELDFADLLENSNHRFEITLPIIVEVTSEEEKRSQLKERLQRYRK